MQATKDPAQFDKSYKLEYHAAPTPAKRGAQQIIFFKFIITSYLMR